MIANNLHLVLPLLAAMMYALGAIALNAATRAGVSGRRATVVANFVLALFFLPFHDWADPFALPQPFWPLLLLAGTFVVGQWFTVLSLALGEVSTVTPVLGLKVILVNLLLAGVLGIALSPAIWVAGALAVLGVAAVRYTGKQPHLNARHAAPAVLMAFLSALSFAGFDVATQFWSARLGFGKIVPTAMVLMALMSLPLLINDRGSWRRVGAAGYRQLLLGSALLGGQSATFVYAIGTFGRAAESNIVYSSRGIWSVLFVWILGHLFLNTELSLRQPGSLIARLIGACLICAAIALVTL